MGLGLLYKIFYLILLRYYDDTSTTTLLAYALMLFCLLAVRPLKKNRPLP